MPSRRWIRLVTATWMNSPMSDRYTVTCARNAVMPSVYLPRELGPLYTLIWRAILSYFTLAFGFVVFSRWVHGRYKQGRGIDEEELAETGAAP